MASTNAIIRIFPNDPAIRYRSAIHEFVARDGESASIGGGDDADRDPPLRLPPGDHGGAGKGERNLRVSRAAFEAAPDDPAHCYNYAMSALMAGERALAREQLERVVELTEGTPRGFRPMALATLGGIYLEDGRLEDALRAGDECVLDRRDAARRPLPARARTRCAGPLPRSA